MCWHDRKAAETIHKLAYDFNISTFVETGTFKGINARYQSKNFKQVFSCEKNREYYETASWKTQGCSNVHLFNISSPEFLKLFVSCYRSMNSDEYVFIYLDAHFYDPKAPREEMWVVLRELQALQNFDKCFICIHDFKCSGLGHLVYDNEPLDYYLIQKDLIAVNPNMYVYCNTRQGCEIHTETSIIGVPGMMADEDTLDNIRYSHTDDRRRFRGMLYCTPIQLDLSRYDLIPFLLEDDN
jgi:hypothetical protein